MLTKSKLRLRVAGLLFVLAGMALMGLGGLSLLEYSVPMARGKYAVAASRLSIGSRADALYNEAYVDFDQHHWIDAAKNCDSAFAALCGDNGQVETGQSAFAAEIQFMLACCRVEQNKHEEAILSYDRCLALMPDAITAQQDEIVRAARRTREWLRQAAKATGKSKPKPDQDKTPAKPKHKARI